MTIETAYLNLLSVGFGELRDPPFSTHEIEATRDLSVVVPVHNAPDETERCLRNLERFSGEAEVVFVDDGSTDSRASRIVLDLALRNSWFMRNNDKGSFHSAACMTGAQLATRPIICLLNSDFVATQHSWSLCVQALRENPALMAVVPMTSAGSVTQIDMPARRCRYAWSDEQIFWFAQLRNRQYRTRRPRGRNRFVTGTALLLRRDDWIGVGGFDDGD